MANHASAIKRARQNEKHRTRNRVRRSAMRTAIKQVDTAVANGDQNVADAALKNAIPLIDRAGQKGVIPRNTASRNVSRLVARVKTLAA